MQVLHEEPFFPLFFHHREQSLQPFACGWANGCRQTCWSSKIKNVLPISIKISVWLYKCTLLSRKKRQNYASFPPFHSVPKCWETEQVNGSFHKVEGLISFEKTKFQPRSNSIFFLGLVLKPYNLPFYYLSLYNFHSRELFFFQKQK